MKILCVYELKTRDSDWLKTFYPCRRLFEECSGRGVEIEFVFPEDACRIFKDLKKGQDGTISENPVCLFRGPVPVHVMEAAEKCGCLCINTSKAFETASDKLLCADLFAKNEIPSPVSIRADKMPENQIDFPVVLKPRKGSRGEDIFLAENKKAADVFFKTFPADVKKNKKPEQYIAQQYIAYSKGRDLRIFFADRKILVMAERINSQRELDGNEIRSNISAGGVFIPLEKSRENCLVSRLKDTMEKIYGVSGLFYGTADFLFKNEEEFLLCEINASPGFEGMEKQLGVNIAGPLIEAIVRATASIPGFPRPA